MPPTEKPRPYSTGDPKSFAHATARRRWPIIVTTIIDDMYRSVSQCPEGERKEEGKRISQDLAKLKYELQHNRQLMPIPDDGLPDVALYNSELEARSPAYWMDMDWLYAECYLYRLLHSYFARSTHWKTYDVFARQKTKTFRSSRPAVVELAAQYRDLVNQTRAGPPSDAPSDSETEKERLLFTEMCEICLWGNATDLSLMTSLTYGEIQKLQGAEARKASEKNILANGLPGAFDLLARARAAGKAERRVDFVLDNAGFELYVDLVLAGYLLETGLATVVVFHPKSIPWFVSDVIPADFADLLNTIASPRAFYETPSEDEQHAGQTPAPLDREDEENLGFLFKEWSALHAEGKLVLRPNEYWTRPGPFWGLPTEAGDLAADLATSELVIFKGDLNYRKLTGDVDWDPTTPFQDAIGGLGPGSGINLLALRTCKADVVVGLKEGDDERLRATEGGGGGAGGRREWAWSGKWAVVSLSIGKQL